MRSTLYGPEQYLLKSKKPHIIALVDNVHSMSIDDINNLNEKSDVIKGLINIKQKKESSDAQSRAEAIAEAMIAAYKDKLQK